MNIENIISHMNNEHKENLIDLAKKFGNAKQINDISLKNVDLEGMDIEYKENKSDKKLRVEFPKVATEDTIKQTIIDICMSAKEIKDFSGIEKEIKDFKKEFGSICIASLNQNGNVNCSYAPIIQTNWGDYIYISQVSEHFSGISKNGDNVEIMFLEDESKAASVILRKRLRYKTQTSEIPRDSEEFNKTFDEFIEITGGSGGIKTIRDMRDFYLFKLNFNEGRFVKGFGQAYDIDKNGKISFAGATGMPHKMPHK